MAFSTSFLTITLILVLVTFPSTAFPRNFLPSSSPQILIRIGLTRMDSSINYTKMELLQRAVRRSQHRLSSLSGSINGTMEAPVHVGQGEFLVDLSIGTPALPFSAIMDTGSDLIWTQCSPCTQCFKQPDPLFNPKSSSSYSTVPCSSEFCGDASIFRCDMNSLCRYVYSYGDQSSTQGFMGTETFTFVDSISVPNLGFGCGVNNQGTGFESGQSSGLLGLGRGSLSLISQLGVRRFSYCLTSIGENKTSSLVLGSLEGDQSYNYQNPNPKTPLVRNPIQPSFYYISLEGISVGETLLPIPRSSFRMRQDGTGGMIVDSGTTITYIQEDAFRLVKREFTSQMSLKVSARSDSTGLDLCFDLPLGDDIVTTHGIEIPKLTFHFQGMDLELPAENYMIVDTSLGMVCLAMAASDSISILGNIQQQNFLVLHDLETESLSFIPTQCDNQV